MEGYLFLLYVILGCVHHSGCPGFINILRPGERLQKYCSNVKQNPAFQIGELTDFIKRCRNSVYMSLGLATIGANTGVVASDSIRSSPEGKPSYDCDKTFRLSKYPVIGVHVGRLDFGGKNVPEHINDILSKGNHKRLLDIIQPIEEQMPGRLSEASDCKVKILLLGREKLRSGKLVIHALEFMHIFKGNINTCKRDPFDGQGAYVHIGDDKARQVIDNKFEKIKLRSMNAAMLVETIKATMKAAIDNCGDNIEFPGSKACGGAVHFLKL